MKQSRIHNASYAFTLAELLIALAILGVIATFTIPKVLQAGQAQQYKAIAKEDLAAVMDIFHQEKLAGKIAATTVPADLIMQLNYIKLINDGSLVIDATPGSTSYPCNAGSPCAVLANGSVIQFTGYSFNGTNSTNVIQFTVDPNGKQDIFTTADGPGKSVIFELYYDGFITTRGNAKANSCHSGTCPFGASPTLDPSWFSWD